MSGPMVEQALGIAVPWSVGAVKFDEAVKLLTVTINSTPGSRFAVQPNLRTACFAGRGSSLFIGIALYQLPIDAAAGLFARPSSAAMMPLAC